MVRRVHWDAAPRFTRWSAVSTGKRRLASWTGPWTARSLCAVAAPTLIALDAGTTGITALLFDSDLRPLARAAREFPQAFPRPGWVEHRAEDICAAADQVLGELALHPRAADAVALGLTNQRETVFALERKSGRALAPGIVWQDRRTSARCQ